MNLPATLAAPTLDERKHDFLLEQQFNFLLSQAKPEALAAPDVVLVCDSAEQEVAFRRLLDARGLGHVGTRVAEAMPAARPLPPLVQALEQVVERVLAEGPPPGWLTRSARQPAGSYTKPTTKARKAARRRAGAARKNSR